MRDLFSKKQTSVFVALPRPPLAKNKRPARNEAPRKGGRSPAQVKHNQVVAQTALPFGGTRRSAQRQTGESSRSGLFSKAASRTEKAILVLVVILLVAVSFGKSYLATEVTGMQAAVGKGHKNMDKLLLEYEGLIKSVTQKKNLGEIEDWAKSKGMVKPDPDKIILVK